MIVGGGVEQELQWIAGMKFIVYKASCKRISIADDQLSMTLFSVEPNI